MATRYLVRRYRGTVHKRALSPHIDSVSWSGPPLAFRRHLSCLRRLDHTLAEQTLSLRHVLFIRLQKPPENLVCRPQLSTHAFMYRSPVLGSRYTRRGGPDVSSASQFDRIIPARSRFRRMR